MDRIRAGIAPAYLFLCLLLGGSSQSVWASAMLQLLAVAIIAWALIEWRDEPLPLAVRQLLALAALALVLVFVQLIPLPPAVWKALPGREFVADGIGILGLALPAMPLSLAPYDSPATVVTVLPALGMLAAIFGLRSHNVTLLALALIAGAMAGILLGILQINSANPEQSPWYLYRISNFGVATGFFANSNHMASLLVVTIPFVAAIGATLRQRAKDARMRIAALAMASGGMFLAGLGIVLNHSLAGYGLGIPVALASAMILFGLSATWSRTVLVAVGVTGIAALALLWTSGIGSQMDRLGAATSVASRQEIAAKSVALAVEFAPVGSGLGTFPKLYPRAEDQASVDRFYVNHAHNDFLELVVETGLPGLLVLVLFLCWWVKVVVQMVRSPAADQFALAGAVASAAILLHSLVDYPLRTGAISAVFVMCLALIIQSRRAVQSETDLRPARHIVID